MAQVSVIIPLYNKEKYIQKTIASVLNQSFKDYELILVDDGSTDASLAIAKQFKDKRIRIFQQENKGVSVARNKGVELAESPLIAFLDADDIWLENHLKTIVSMAKSNKNASFFATGYIIKYNKRLRRNIVFEQFKDKESLLDKYYQYIKGSNLFYTSNFAIRKTIFLQEKGFKNIDTEDTEFFIRIGHNYKICYSKEITMQHVNFSEGSLFKSYNLDKKVLLLDYFKIEEKNDKALKAYLDLNRYSWAIEYKINNEFKKFKLISHDISKKNLNYKQRILLCLPSSILKLLKKVQHILMFNNIYISPFSK